MKVSFSKSFIKSYQKYSTATQDKFQIRLVLLNEDPTSLQLRVHKLTGKYQGYYSFNVTGDVRAIYRKINHDSLHFTVIGTHSELYS